MSDNERKEDGSLVIGVTLPPDIARQFLSDADDEVRTMSEMARWIITKHYRTKKDRSEFEEFKRLQSQKLVGEIQQVGFPPSPPEQKRSNE